MIAYLVDAHYGNDYWVRSNGTDEQADEIEAECETCGDHDRIVGTAETPTEAKRLIAKYARQLHGLDADYRQELLENYVRLTERTSNR